MAARVFEAPSLSGCSLFQILPTDDNSPTHLRLTAVGGPSPGHHLMFVAVTLATLGLDTHGLS